MNNTPRQLQLLFTQPDGKSSASGEYHINWFLRSILQSIDQNREHYDMKGIPVKFEQFIKDPGLCWHTRMFMIIAWVCTHDDDMKVLMTSEDEWMKLHFPAILKEVFGRAILGLNVWDGSRFEWVDKKKLIGPAAEELTKQMIQYIMSQIVEIYMRM